MDKRPGSPFLRRISVVIRRSPFDSLRTNGEPIAFNRPMLRSWCACRTMNRLTTQP